MLEICKRIRATSGQWIVYQADYGIGQYQIPEGHVLLLGDNLNNSHDSRHYGPVPMGLLYGKAICRVSFSNYPFFQMLPKEPPAKAVVVKDQRLEYRQAENELSALREEDKKKADIKLSSEESTENENKSETVVTKSIPDEQPTTSNAEDNSK